jgi:hypothetical protein
MMFSRKKNEEDKPHTIVSTYVEQGRGRIETYYYGEAQAPIEPIKDLNQLRVTKGASIQEILRESILNVRIKKSIKMKIEGWLRIIKASRH